MSIGIQSEGTALGDTLYGGAGDDWLDGGRGNDQLWGGEGGDTLLGGGGNDTLTGQVGDDLLQGGRGDDGLNGGDGNDTLDGGTGDDLLSGGYGADEYVYGRGRGDDRISDYAPGAQGELDVLRLQGLAPADVHAERLYDSLRLTIRDTGETLWIDGYFSGTSDAAGIGHIERIVFADGTAWALADTSAAVRGATEGNDHVWGGDALDDALSGLAGNDDIHGAGGNDLLAGDAGNDTLWGDDGNDSLAGGAGDDQLAGGAGDDTLDGGRGNDVLWGDGGTDTFLFGRGSGNDFIYGFSHDASGFDRIVLQGLDAGDVVVRTAYDQLYIRILDTDETLSVAGYFSDGQGQGSPMAANIVFADGSTWTPADALAATHQPSDLSEQLYGTNDADTVLGAGGNDTVYAGEGADSVSGGAGNDDLSGDGGNDTLDGGSGNDRLSGGYGSDTYLFGRGAGADTIDNMAWGADPADADTIRLANLNPEDVTLRRDASWDDGTADLLLTVRDTGETLRVQYQFGYYAADAAIDQIVFANGTVYGAAEIAAATLQASDAADAIDGTGDADSLAGLAGADTLTGLGGDDTLVGGGQDDSLDGGSGNDLLQGDSGKDTLYGSDGDDVLLGGAGADRIEGGWGDDTLAGGRGDDALVGGRGMDTYVFGRGDGRDAIDNEALWDWAAPDHVQLAGLAEGEVLFRQDGLDLVGRIADTSDELRVLSFFEYGPDDFGRMNTLEFDFSDGAVWTYADVVAHLDTVPALDVQGTPGADLLAGGIGNDTLAAGEGNDTLDGGAGDDVLEGGPGDDTYIFRAGAGRDAVHAGDGGDTIVLEGLLPSDVQVRRDGADLAITIADTGDQLRVSDFWEAGSANTVHAVGSLHFADGQVWGLPEIEAAIATPSSEDDTLYGSDAADAMPDGGGNDFIAGLGGNDTLGGGSGTDTLDGGAGDDLLLASDGARLVGGSGSDQYEFVRAAAPHGVTIFEAAGDAGTDTVRLLDVNLADVTMRQQDGDLLLRADTGDVLVRVEHYFDGAQVPGFQPGVESFVFADGTTWGYEQVRAAVVTGTAGDDEIAGTALDELVSGGAGRDDLDGGAGNDTLQGGSGGDTLVDYAGNNLLQGGAGDDYLSAGDGDDTLVGGAGNDNMSGGLGADTFVFGRGDGNDTAYGSWGADAAVDRIALRELAPADVDLRAYSNGLVITVHDTGDALYLPDYFRTGGVTADAGAPDLVFGDGTVWGYAQASAAAAADPGVPHLAVSYPGSTVNAGDAGEQMLLSYEGDAILLGGGGADYLQGGPGDDVLDGGADGDYLSGNGGSDTYVFGPGSGHDQLGNATYGDDDPGIDSVHLFALTPADVAFDRVGNDLLVSPVATSDTLLVSGYFLDGGTSGYTVERFEFANGSVWGYADVAAAVDADATSGSAASDTLTGGAGNDALYGQAGDDTLAGGTGDDYLQGDGGADTYVFGAGSGHDAVYDGGGDDPATVDTVLLQGLNAGDISVAHGLAFGGFVNEDLVITVHSSGETLRVLNHFADPQIERIAFADGSSWNADDIAAAALASTSGDDYLRGYDASADHLAAGEGDDTVLGGGGDDQLLGGSGNDALDGGAGDDLLDGGAGANLLAGGTGADRIVLAGGAAAVVAFNAGDGLDTIVDAGSQPATLSLGHVDYASLELLRTGNDLTLVTGEGEGVVLTDWFNGQQGVGTLQMFMEGTASYDYWSYDALHNSKVVEFDFAQLAAQFDQQGAGGPWALAPSLGDTLLYAGDAPAAGGDLAAAYARDGSLADAGTVVTLSLVGRPEFGDHGIDVGLV